MRKKEATGYQGISYGMMDGIINSMGVLAGLSVTAEPFIILLGVLVASLANSFANAGGIHVSLETGKNSRKEVWKSTIYSFVVTFLVMVLIALPIVFLPFRQAIILSIAIGFILLVALGLFVRKVRKEKSYDLVIEYTSLGVIVSVVCLGAGELIKLILGSL